MDNTDSIIVVYDDQCPFCRSYCKLVKLRKATGEVVLVDAREPSDIMTEITRRGMNIDHGMVVIIKDEFYYGSDAIHILSLLSSRSDLFNRLNFFIFKSKRVSRVLYPILKNCRNLALWLLGIPFIKNLDQSDANAN